MVRGSGAFSGCRGCGGHCWTSCWWQGGRLGTALPGKDTPSLHIPSFLITLRALLTPNPTCAQQHIFPSNTQFMASSAHEPEIQGSSPSSQWTLQGAVSSCQHFAVSGHIPTRAGAAQAACTAASFLHAETSGHCSLWSHTAAWLDCSSEDITTLLSLLLVPQPCCTRALCQAQ